MNRNSYFKDAEIFLNGLAEAKKHGLEYEFVAEFLKCDQSRSVAENVSDALYEWDI